MLRILRRAARRCVRTFAFVVVPVATVADEIVIRLVNRGVPRQLAILFTLFAIITILTFSLSGAIQGALRVPRFVAWFSMTEIPLPFFHSEIVYKSGPVLTFKVEVYPSLTSACLVGAQGCFLIIMACAVACHRCCYLLLFFLFWTALMVTSIWFLTM